MKQKLIGSFLIIGIGLLVYGASLSNGMISWDDGILIRQNEYIRAISWINLKTIFTSFVDPELYIPLTFVSYQINYLFGGTAPFGYHLGNVLLHLLNAMLVWKIAEHILKRKWTSYLVALLFLMHPINAEAIGWAAARKDVLAGAFALGSILFFLSRYNKTSALLFLCALLSKPTVVFLPFLLLALDWRQWKNVIPHFFFIALPIGVIAYIGKMQLAWSIPIWERVLLAMRSFTFSLSQVFIPNTFSITHPYGSQMTFFSPDILLSLIVVIVVGTFFAALRNSESIRISGLWFIAFLLPALIAFIHIEPGTIYLPYDRYLYLPAIGLYMLTAISLERLAVNMKGKWQMAIPALSIILCIGLGMKAHAQSLHWYDSETIFKHSLSIYPGDIRMERDLQAYYIVESRRAEERDDPVAAEQFLLRAQEQDPNAFLVYNQLGILYTNQRLYGQALEQFEKAVEIQPTFAPAQENVERLRALIK